MKSLEEVQEELEDGTVYETLQFAKLVEEGSITSDEDAYGYYHDGKHETDEHVWLKLKDILQHAEEYPYVIWYHW